MPESNIRIKLSKKLRLLRKGKGLTQEEVAEKAGISPRYYQILESSRPRTGVTVEVLERLGRVLGKKFLNL